MLNIPEDMTLQEFTDLQTILGGMLQDLDASQISMRLNESQRNGGELFDDRPFFQFSYFVASVQNEDTQNKRRQKAIVEPGLYRFGDNVPSKEVREAVAKAVAGNTADLFANRVWSDVSGFGQDALKKGMGSKGMGRESGLKCQKYIGLRINGRCVGTLGVSFADDAGQLNMQQIEAKIVGWAREPGSPTTLIDHLKAHFNLWGPQCL